MGEILAEVMESNKKVKREQLVIMRSLSLGNLLSVHFFSLGFDIGSRPPFSLLISLSFLHFLSLSLQQGRLLSRGRLGISQRALRAPPLLPSSTLPSISSLSTFLFSPSPCLSLFPPSFPSHSPARPTGLVVLSLPPSPSLSAVAVPQAARPVDLGPGIRSLPRVLALVTGTECESCVWDCVSSRSCCYPLTLENFESHSLPFVLPLFLPRSPLVPQMCVGGIWTKFPKPFRSWRSLEVKVITYLYCPRLLTHTHIHSTYKMRVFTFTRSCT